MRCSRRRVPGSAAAFAILGRTGGWWSPARAEDRDVIGRHARPGTARLAPSGYPQTPIWG